MFAANVAMDKRIAALEEELQAVVQAELDEAECRNERLERALRRAERRRVAGGGIKDRDAR